MGVSIWEGGKAERMTKALETVAKKLTKDQFTDPMKQALLDMFSKVAFIDDDGQSYIDALSSALYSEIGVKSISVVFTQGNTDITPSTPLSSLKNNLVVTATMDDDTTETVDDADYTITGTLTSGISTLTVTCSGKTATFNCLVAYNLAEAVTFTEGSDNIDTGWATTFADELSICCDVTITSLHAGNYNMIYSTFLTSAGDAYLGFNAVLTNGGEYKLSGCGISNSDAAGNITGVNQRIRSVAILNMTTGKITNRFYNVTNDVTKNLNNTYNVEYIESDGRHIFIGHPDQSGGWVMGTNGTFHSFKILGRALSESEIVAYLAGE